MHHYQKRWFFTWNNSSSKLPHIKSLEKFLDKSCESAVFQVERGELKNKIHYQGRLTLKGKRLGKRALLKLFSSLGDVENLTLKPEVSMKDSVDYCTKSSTRLSGPYFCGSTSFKLSSKPPILRPKGWELQFLGLLIGPTSCLFRKRKVIWIQDSSGGHGKSEFLRFLTFDNNGIDLVARKLPIASITRMRSAVCKVQDQINVDLFMFNLTRTRSQETTLEDLFELVEELKDSLIVDVMYGEYRQCLLDYPFVVIFTNEDIKNYRKYLSDDRWVPFVICSDNTLSYIDEDDMRIGFEDFLLQLKAE